MFKGNVTQYTVPIRTHSHVILALQSFLDGGIRCRALFEELHPFLHVKHKIIQIPSISIFELLLTIPNPSMRT